MTNDEKSSNSDSQEYIKDQNHLPSNDEEIIVLVEEDSPEIESPKPEQTEIQQSKNTIPDLNDLKLGTKKKTVLKSFKKPMVKLDQIGKKNQDEGDKGPELITEIEPYTEEDLKAAWMSYVDNLDEIKNSAEFRLLNKAYEYSNNMAEILIDNPIEEDVFKEIKTEFITNIRRRLRNKNFDIRLKIDQSEKKKIIYTPHDKFEHLAEKYPAMRELKQRLGLEFEF